MEEEARFWEAIIEGMAGDEIGVDSRGRVLHFEPWIPECDLCGAKDTAGDQTEYDAGDTTIRLCSECA